MKQMDITAFGEILIDFTYIGNSEQGQKLFAQNAGGAPANVLVCATKFGSQTAFLGKVGDDMHGAFLRQTLMTENVNVDGLVTDPDYFTTLAFVDLNDQGERSFSFARKHGADTFMRKEDIDLSILENSKIFHVGSLSLTTALGRETTMHAIQKAKQAGALISYDPNYRASLWACKSIAIEEMRAIVPYADLMKISDEECVLLTGASDPISAAKALHDMGVTVVCVTLGKGGALVSTAHQCQIVTGYTPKRVADTTGAGDSFWGGFLHQLIGTKKPLDQITFEELLTFAKFANATASLCIEQNGAIRAMPSLEAVENRMSDTF